MGTRVLTYNQARHRSRLQAMECGWQLVSKRREKVPFFPVLSFVFLLQLLFALKKRNASLQCTHLYLGLYTNIQIFFEIFRSFRDI